MAKASVTAVAAGAVVVSALVLGALAKGVSSLIKARNTHRFNTFQGFITYEARAETPVSPRGKASKNFRVCPSTHRQIHIPGSRFLVGEEGPKINRNY